MRYCNNTEKRGQDWLHSLPSRVLHFINLLFQDIGFPDEKIVGGVPFYGYGFPGEGNEGAYSMTYAKPELSLLGRIHSLLKAQ